MHAMIVREYVDSPAGDAYAAPDELSPRLVMVLVVAGAFQVSGFCRSWNVS